jgi:iron complex transport system permease protein
MKQNLKNKIIFLFVILIISIISGLILGSVKINLMEIFLKDNRAILKIRIARILLGLFTGAGLGVSGVALQAILRNPLADPYLLGTSSGAGLGAVIGIFLGLSGIYMPFAAFVGALLSIALVYNIAKENNKVEIQSLILSGIIVGISFSGLIVFLVSVSNSRALHGMMWWLLGSLQVYDFKLLLLVGLIVLSGLILIFILSQDLNAISLGEEEAVHLGVEPENVKKIVLITTALITGALVSISGIIGFVGLIIPHIMRLYIGPNHKVLIPASCIGAPAFLVFCDTLSRSLAPPIEIPIGVITALLGAPVFIILLKRQYKLSL